MKRNICLLLVALSALSLAGLSNGCAGLQSVKNALTGASKLQFKLDNVTGFKVSNIDISHMSQLNQINPLDMVRLGTQIAQKSLPVSFTLNVLAKNPNDGSAGTQATPLYLRKLAWTLLIDNRTTIQGVVDQRLAIPGTGQSITIPLTVQLDLYKFFGDKGLNDLLNLGLAIGGAQGSASNLKLTARVSIENPFIAGQVIEYPGDLTIVDKQFSNP